MEQNQTNKGTINPTTSCKHMDRVHRAWSHIATNRILVVNITAPGPGQGVEDYVACSSAWEVTSLIKTRNVSQKYYKIGEHPTHRTIFIFM